MYTPFKTNSPHDAHKFFTNKMSYTTGPVELNSHIEKHDAIVIIDVRAAKDYGQAHIPGAINLPEENWSDLSALAQDKMNIIYCYSHVCHLAARAAVEFSSKGFSVMELEGGMEAWKAHNLRVEGGPYQVEEFLSA